MIVKNVFIGNRELPVKFNFGALRILEELAGIPYSQALQKMQTDMSTKLTAQIIFAGLKGGGAGMKTPFKMTFEELQTELDSMSFNDVTKIVTTIFDDMPQGESDEEPTAEKAKN